MANVTSTVLKPREVLYIASVVQIAKDIGIENLIIEKTKVRGKSPDGMIFLLQEDGHPDVSFDKMGLNRISSFCQRYAALRELEPKFTIDEVELSVNGTPTKFVRSVHMKARGAAIDFRCANPVTIKQIPSQILDPVFYAMPNTPELATAIQQAKATMGAELIGIAVTSGNLQVQAQDITGDNFSRDISANEITIMDDAAEDDFIFEYGAPELISLIKKANGDCIYITQHGMLKLSIDGFNVYLKPKVE